MPKPRETKEPDKERRIQVSLDNDLAQKGRVIAAFLGISLPDLVNQRLRYPPSWL